MGNKCRLCEEERQLKNSHIIPKLFYNSIKKDSITGYMRTTANPNKREQDGLKTPLLCGICEEKFSKYETWFSNNVFTPTKENTNYSFSCKNDELNYFMLSIAWRLLVFHGKDENFTSKENQRIQEVTELWRTYLNDENMEKIRNIQQFIIPTAALGIFDDISFRRTDNVLGDFRTYDEQDAFKFGFTFIQVPYFIMITTVWGHTDILKGNDIRKNRIIKPRNTMLPKSVLNLLEDYHKTKYLEAYDKITANQQEKIMKDINNKKGMEK